MDTLVVRRMTEDELGLALDWAAEEGWNPGLFNSASFIAADADGFFLGECGGEPIGCVSAVRYGERFGFLGLYIVKPQHRGKGFGLKLWRAAMEHFGDRNIGLDGVVAQQQRYTKSGFKLAWRNIRYQGEGGGAAPAGLADLSSIPFDEILRYDALAFPPPAKPSFEAGSPSRVRLRSERSNGGGSRAMASCAPAAAASGSVRCSPTIRRSPTSFFAVSPAARPANRLFSMRPKRTPPPSSSPGATAWRAGLRDRADVHQGGPVGRPEPMFWNDHVSARLGCSPAPRGDDPRLRADRHSQASGLIEVDNGDNGRATARAHWPLSGPGAMPPSLSPRQVLARVLSRAVAMYPRQIIRVAHAIPEPDKLKRCAERQWRLSSISRSGRPDRGAPISHAAA